MIPTGKHTLQSNGRLCHSYANNDLTIDFQISALGKAGYISINSEKNPVYYKGFWSSTWQMEINKLIVARAIKQHPFTNKISIAEYTLESPMFTNGDQILKKADKTLMLASNIATFSTKISISLKDHIEPHICLLAIWLSVHRIARGSIKK